MAEKTVRAASEDEGRSSSASTSALVRIIEGQYNLERARAELQSEHDDVTAVLEEALSAVDAATEILETAESESDRWTASAEAADSDSSVSLE